MFAVIFEVRIRPGLWDDYLAQAGLLRPELLKIDGFVDNVRYRSLTRDGLLLSLSSWRDEKSLIRWRTQATHHDAQEKGRTEVFADYHLRIGQITADSRLPDGHALREQRLDETETGAARTVTLFDAPSGRMPTPDIADGAPGLVARDIFDAVLTPGDGLLLLSWQDDAAAAAFEQGRTLPGGVRSRRVRVIRDYGMFDRREAPQYYPEVVRL